jgi:putative transposase
MTEELKRKGYPVNRKRIRRLMQIMGLQAIYRRPRTSPPGKGHKIYPYLLKGLKIERPNQAWAADITYIPMKKGFLYLVAIIDLYSRYVLAWRLSNSMETGFCVEALKEALQKGTPEIFNTDQGSQFTSDELVSILVSNGIKVSMDSVGRYADNIFVERFWRTLKYEEVYLKAYQDGRTAKSEIGKYIRFYNTERPHQALGYKTPARGTVQQRLQLLKDICYNPINQERGSHLNL